MSSFCRLCSLTSPKCQPLQKNNAIEMLESLTAIKVSYREKSSAEICPLCYKDLKLGYEIQQRILKVELKHEEEMLTDFLIENHEELVKIVQSPLHDVKDSNKSPLNENVEIAKHICKLCDEKFQLSPAYVKHLQLHILENDHNAVNSDIEGGLALHCQYCEGAYTNQNEYDAHLNSTHSNECDRCFEVFPLKSELEAHILQAHTDKKQRLFVCEVCNETFALRYVLQLHKVQHNTDYRFECECGRKFKHEIGLTAHKLAKKQLFTN